MSRVPVREAVAVVVTLALIGVATRAWETAQSGWETVRHPAPPRSHRELGGVLGRRMDFALAKAPRVSPRDAPSAVRVAYDPPIDSSIVEAIPGLFQYW